MAAELTDLERALQQSRIDEQKRQQKADLEDTSYKDDPAYKAAMAASLAQVQQKEVKLADKPAANLTDLEQAMQASKATLSEDAKRRTDFEKAIAASLEDTDTKKLQKANNDQKKGLHFSPQGGPSKRPFAIIQNILKTNKIEGLGECDCCLPLKRDSANNARDYIDEKIVELAQENCKDKKTINLAVVGAGRLMQAATIGCGFLQKGYSVNFTLIDIGYENPYLAKAIAPFKSVLLQLNAMYPGDAKIDGVFGNYDNYLATMEGKKPLQYTQKIMGQKVGVPRNYQVNSFLPFSAAQTKRNVMFQKSFNTYRGNYLGNKSPDFILIIDDVLELGTYNSSQREVPGIGEIVYDNIVQGTKKINPKVKFLSTIKKHTSKGKVLQVRVDGSVVKEYDRPTQKLGFN